MHLLVCVTSWKTNLSPFYSVLLRVWAKLAAKLCCHLSNDYHSCHRIRSKDAEQSSRISRTAKKGTILWIVHCVSSPSCASTFSSWLIAMAWDGSCGWFECKFTLILNAMPINYQCNDRHQSSCRILACVSQNRKIIDSWIMCEG